MPYMPEQGSWSSHQQLWISDAREGGSAVHRRQRAVRGIFPWLQTL